MTKYLLLIFISISLISCTTKTNMEIVLSFKNAEIDGSTSDYADHLHEHAIALFTFGKDTMRKKDLILNREFNQPFEPWSKIMVSKDINDSTIELSVLETSNLHRLFGIDTLAYLFRY